MLTRTSRLLPIIGGLALLVAFVVVMKSCSDSETEVASLASVPEAPSPDADSPADTIKTLTANVSELITEVETLRRDNNALRIEARERATEISNQVSREISTFNRDRVDDQRVRNSDLELLQQRIDELSSELESNYALLASANTQAIPLPEHLGLASPVYSWLAPIGQDATSALGSFDIETTPAKAVLTVPRNATLIDSTVMTALVGRVPLNGHVRDPMPFKVLTGAENLAANGLKIEDVHGMVWSGLAFGDWTLSCVSGRLDSVTFVFEDGSIRTISVATDSQSETQQSLGWISDEYGVPCLAGERKSNAGAYLSQQLGIGAMKAAAEATAAVETTNNLSILGASQNIVDGDIGNYVLGKTAAGAADATALWLAQRANQEYDAIFVPAGQKVAIHVDRELQIDLEQGGRKLSHEDWNAVYRHSNFD